MDTHGWSHLRIPSAPTPPAVLRGSVGSAATNYPFVGLAGDGGDALEVCVVVEHGELAGFSYCPDEGINQGERPVLA